MKRKSENQKKLSGTYRKDRSRKVERGPEMQVENIPDPKSYLSTRGAEIYYNVCSFLNHHGLLNGVVAMQVNIYASLQARYEENEILLQEEGECKEIYSKEGNFLHYQLNPRVKISTAYCRAAISWAKHLLLMPVDYDRLPGPKTEEDNPFADLMPNSGKKKTSD